MKHSRNISSNGAHPAVTGCSALHRHAKALPWRWASCAFLIATQFLAGTAGAADKLQADLIPLGLRTRSEAPIPADIRLKWDGLSILQGRLEVVLQDGGQVLGQYRSDDMALTTGEQRFRVLLPPFVAPSSDPQVEVQLKFVTAGDTFDLGSSSLFMPTRNERSLVLGWCNSRVASATQTLDLQQSLMFDRFTPQSADVPQRSLLTSAARLTPEDLPIQPLSYTAFDVMVLTADGFAEAHAAQLEAVARWVKGGGSVCVFAGGGLQAHHLSFLNELADSSSEGATFFADNSGNLAPGQKKISCLHSGVGRSVIVAGDVGADPALDSLAWRQAVAFLWKVRDSQTAVAVQTRHLETNTNEPTNEVPTSIDDYAAQAQSFRRANRPTPILMTLAGIDKAVALTDIEKPKVQASLDDWNAARKQLGGTTPTERRSKMQAFVQAFDTKMQEILTPDQYKKFKAARLTPPIPRGPTRPPRSFNGLTYSIASPYGVQPSLLGTELMGQLMPTTVRLIPFPALLGTLGLFLLMIGPVDYFALGWIKRRRFTWILFPATTLVFVLATVLMANHYLGAHDQRRSLIIVDLGKDGTALRWSRYELIFAARDKLAETQLTNGLWAPLDVGAMAAGIQPMPMTRPGPAAVYGPVTVYGRPYRPSYGPGGFGGGGFAIPQVSGDTGPPWYDGVLPSHFRTTELIHQWQPRLNRIFSFEPPPVPLLPNWRGVETAWPDLENIRGALSAPKAFTGDICVISNSNSLTPDPASTGISPGQVIVTGNGTVQNTWVNIATASPYQVARDSGSRGILPDPILSQLCRADTNGLMSIVSQISPTGGGNFEDVQGMQTGDCALAIVTQSGDDIVIYRRFFHGN